MVMTITVMLNFAELAQNTGGEDDIIKQSRRGYPDSRGGKIGKVLKIDAHH